MRLFRHDGSKFAASLRRNLYHRPDVSDVKDFDTAATKEKPRRNLAKRASSVGLGN